TSITTEIYTLSLHDALPILIKSGVSGRSSMAERQLPKLHTRVRFPSPAPSPNNFPKRSPLLIEMSDRIRIFDRNNVQHFVQQNVDRKSTRLNSSHVSISYAV